MILAIPSQGRVLRLAVVAVCLLAAVWALQVMALLAGTAVTAAAVVRHAAQDKVCHCLHCSGGARCCCAKAARCAAVSR